MCAVTILEDSALTDADRMDAELKAGKYRGPLHGLPWGVKDLFAVKGTPTTWGAADFENRVIDEDSEAVVRLRDAGAVLIAKLSTGQFAQGGDWFRGGTKNPWNTSQRLGRLVRRTRLGLRWRVRRLWYWHGNLGLHCWSSVHLRD
jgi:Asp-tRNA(Asn)/Glu-tRNA(Gln) amidotransferase A subunit family amidase